MYKGTNLIRMDAAAKTNEPWVAYKYDAGLKGFSTDLTPRVTWRDTGWHPQLHQFGGVVNATLARVKAQNRLIVAEAGGAALAAFPPPHTFFFTREKDTNLGYVDRKSTRLNSSHSQISYAVFCLKKKNNTTIYDTY